MKSIVLVSWRRRSRLVVGGQGKQRRKAVELRLGPQGGQRPFSVVIAVEDGQVGNGGTRGEGKTRGSHADLRSASLHVGLAAITAAVPALPAVRARHSPDHKTGFALEAVGQPTAGGRGWYALLLRFLEAPSCVAIAFFFPTTLFWNGIFPRSQRRFPLIAWRSVEGLVCELSSGGWNRGVEALPETYSTKGRSRL